MKAASDPDCRGFPSVLRLLGEYDDAKPAEKKQVEGKVEMVVVVQREGRRQNSPLVSVVREPRADEPRTLVVDHASEPRHEPRKP